MNIISLLKTVFTKPSFLFGRGERIFLISHMRGNTSLLSHLLGSHPEINGYYEMHMGYHSVKSLFRQKLLFLDDHLFKPDSRFMFDKLLHNEHHIHRSLLNTSDNKIIIMIREPEQTVKSIVNLYQKIDSNHEFAQVENACRYYIERLEYIADMAKKITGNYYYLKADDIRQKPETTLSPLGDWLTLKQPIPLEYESFKFTGKQKSGDSSKQIKSGKIQAKNNNYDAIQIDADNLARINSVYTETVEFCINNAAH